MVLIYTHNYNLSAILAILSFWQESELVSEIRYNLTSLGKTHRLTLVWVPAWLHGNELAHQLACEAANMEFVEPMSTIPIWVGSVHECIDKWSRDRHTLIWNRGMDCRMVKRIIQLPSNAVAKQWQVP